MDFEDNLMNYLDNQYEEAGKLVEEEENQISLTSKFWRNILLVLSSRTSRSLPYIQLVP